MMYFVLYYEIDVVCKFHFIFFQSYGTYLTVERLSVRIGGVTILRKGKADLISDGETGA